MLPKTFAYNRKQGLNVPIDDWFKSKEWSIFLKDVLLDFDQNIFSHSYIEELINSHISGNLQGERLYGLLMFELWRKEYGITAI
jgi:asparagine synthase (glutamine-hydrolysing)